MKDIIQAFLDSGMVAIAGASNNKENFGRYLMTELIKLDKEVFPVNPRCQEIEGRTCVPTVKDLPGEVENLILAVPPGLTNEIVDQCVGTSIKRVWMVKGIGKGAYSEKAYAKCSESNLEVVYGFCPLMFYGEGMHKFHLWLRKTFGKLPAEFQLAAN
jgi:predicted CoA-binding protein